MRVDGDASDTFNKPAGLDLDDKLYYGASVKDAVAYLKYVCVGNRELGIKLKYEFRRVEGRHDKSHH